MNKDVAGLVARLEGEKIWITQPRPANELELEAASTIRALVSENERLTDLADKYKWQVRDTCTRAEAAEAKLRKAVEMMQALREETAALLERYDDHEQSNHPNAYVTLQRIAAFLAAQEDSTSECAAWPSGCHKNSSCARHRDCMYGCKTHRDRPHADLAAEIDAETARRTGGQHQ